MEGEEEGSAITKEWTSSVPFTYNFGGGPLSFGTCIWGRKSGTFGVLAFVWAEWWSVHSTPQHTHQQFLSNFLVAFLNRSYHLNKSFCLTAWLDDSNMQLLRSDKQAESPDKLLLSIEAPDNMTLCPFTMPPYYILSSLHHSEEREERTTGTRSMETRHCATTCYVVGHKFLTRGCRSISGSRSHSDLVVRGSGRNRNLLPSTT